MSTRWNVPALREYIRTRPPPTEVEIKLVNSIGQAQRLFEYHKNQALQELKKVPTFDGDANDHAERVLMLLEDDRSAAFMAEVHVTGCVNTVRNSYDYIAGLVNLLVLTEPLTKKRLYADDIWKKLPRGPISDAFDQIESTDAYRYVVAFNNTLKHRQHISFATWIDFENNRAGIGPLAFKDPTGDQSYRTAREVLEYSTELWNGMISIGRLINDHLRVNAE